MYRSQCESWGPSYLDAFLPIWCPQASLPGENQDTARHWIHSPGLLACVSVRVTLAHSIEISSSASSSLPGSLRRPLAGVLPALLGVNTGLTFANARRRVPWCASPKPVFRLVPLTSAITMRRTCPWSLGGIRAPRSRATTATATEIGQAPAGGRRLSRTERAHPAAPGEQMAVALGH